MLSNIALLFSVWVYKKVRNDQRSKVSLSSLDCNQHMRDLCIYDYILFQLTLKQWVFLSSLLWVCKKFWKKWRPLQKSSGSRSILNKYDPMHILCRFTLVWTFWWFWQLIFWFFLFNSTLRSRSKVMVEFSDTSV